jgi:hypothetical protein
VDVYKWALQARRGDTIRYWTNPGDGALPLILQEPAARASREGLVFLAQRRAGGRLRYEATRIDERTAELLGLIGRRGIWSRLGEGRLAA